MLTLVRKLRDAGHVVHMMTDACNRPEADAVGVRLANAGAAARPSSSTAHSALAYECLLHPSGHYVVSEDHVWMLGNFNSLREQARGYRHCSSVRRPAELAERAGQELTKLRWIPGF